MDIRNPLGLMGLVEANQLIYNITLPPMKGDRYAGFDAAFMVRVEVAVEGRFRVAPASADGEIASNATLLSVVVNSTLSIGGPPARALSLARKITLPGLSKVSFYDWAQNERSAGTGHCHLHL